MGKEFMHLIPGQTLVSECLTGLCQCCLPHFQSSLPGAWCHLPVKRRRWLMKYSLLVTNGGTEEQEAPRGRAVTGGTGRRVARTRQHDIRRVMTGAAALEGRGA